MLKIDETPAAHFFDTLGGTPSHAPSSALVLDYDGTLAPFQVDRFQAVPWPGIPHLLRAIIATRRTRVVLVSGRKSEEVRDLLGIVPPPEVWGLHGGQRLHPDGRSELLPMKEADRDALQQAAAWIHHEGLTHLAEFKPSSVALHWRALTPQEKIALGERVHAAFEPLARSTSMSLLRFDGGLELRPSEPHKGTAVRTLLRELPPGAPFAYLGDDLTDEDAFLALHGTGALTVLVRPEYRPTAAQLWLRPPQELVEFLCLWLRRVGGAA